MEEQMGRRTVGGLILTRGGSILVYRDEKENPNSHKPSRKSKHNPEPSRRKITTSSVTEESSRNNNNNNNKNKRDQSEKLTTRINRRVNSITRTVSQIQGSLRGKSANSSESSNGSTNNSSSTNTSRMKKREGDRILCDKGRCGQARGDGFRERSLTPNNERRNRNGVAISRFIEGQSANLSRASSEEDAGYWHFNLDDNTERFLEQESNSFLDDSSWPDRHREMRMDIDDMSYEELLAFCERIGTVNTGLSEASLSECIKRSLYVHISSNKSKLDKEGGDIKCIICQEEYSFGEETGKIKCGHFYHMNCINQWLRLKNWCPICKALASPYS